MKREWLGILVNDGMIDGIRKRNTGHEKLEFYHEAGLKYGLSTCFFGLRDISWIKNQVHAFIFVKGKWVQRGLPIPKIIHNRAIFTTKQNWNRSKRLVDRGIILFNFWNRYGKLYIANVLKEHSSFTSHLPVTLPFTAENLNHIMEQSTSFFLKPNKGTVGEGIIKLDKEEEATWLVSYRVGKQLVRHPFQENELYHKVKKTVGKNEYFLQETIPLATFQGSPFDIRVSVQKNGEGVWGITGMMGKVARTGHFLSNVAQGGKVMKVEELLSEYPHLSKEKEVKKISDVALSMVEYLSGIIPHLADVGFDFGIDEKGHPYFIEMNGRDQRYSFMKGGESKTWKQTYENPVAYARFLLNQKKVTRTDEADHRNLIR